MNWRKSAESVALLTALFRLLIPPSIQHFPLRLFQAILKLLSLGCHCTRGVTLAATLAANHPLLVKKVKILVFPTVDAPAVFAKRNAYSLSFWTILWEKTSYGEVRETLFPGF